MSKKPKHDEIIRSAFENPLVSKEFFEMHLPSHIQNLISFEKLKMEKDSFVDKRLKKSIVDILFSAKFGDKKGYLYLLLEHQSTPEYKMALRLFRYMFKIAEYHKKSTKSKKFPFIYPLIFYNGVQKYNAPRNLWELFENSELIKTTWTNDYQLINVHDIPDEKLKEKAWSGILQFFMKHIHERDLLKRWEEVADLLPKFAKIDIGIEHIELILCYTLTRIKQDDIIEVEKLLKSKLNLKKRENIMKSIAHHWMQQGREEEKAFMAKNMKSIAHHWIQQGREEEKAIMAEKVQEEKVMMAKEMMKEGFSLESVIKITKLSKEDLEK